MMSEIPKSRINITLELELNGQKQRKELPLKLLFLGNFSNSSNKTPLFKRQTHYIHKNNFDDILKFHQPTLEYTVINKIDSQHDLLPISLSFNKLKDFHPESVACQIPQIKRLIAMRNLLKDLRAITLDNVEFRKQFKALIQEKTNIRKTLQHLQKQAPLNKHFNHEEH